MTNQKVRVRVRYVSYLETPLWIKAILIALMVEGGFLLFYQMFSQRPLDVMGTALLFIGVWFCFGAVGGRLSVPRPQIEVTSPWRVTFIEDHPVKTSNQKEIVFKTFREFELYELKLHAARLNEERKR